MTTPHRDILLAEAHRDCRETLAMALEMAGYSVHAVRSGEEALVWLRTFTPGTVLLDTHLRGITGLDIARVMRANRRFDATRVLLTSTWMPPEHRDAALALGVDSVWQKPFDLAKLLTMVENVPPAKAARG